MIILFFNLHSPFFNSLDVILKLIGLNVSYNTKLYNHGFLNLSPALLFAEHSLYFFILALELVVHYMRSNSTELLDLLRFLSELFQLPSTRLLWRYSIYSHPCSLFILPTISHFLISVVPISSIIMYHMVSGNDTCQQIVDLVFYDHWLGLLYLLFSFYHPFLCFSLSSLSRYHLRGLRLLRFPSRAESFILQLDSESAHLCRSLLHRFLGVSLLLHL